MLSLGGYRVASENATQAVLTRFVGIPTANLRPSSSFAGATAPARCCRGRGHCIDGDLAAFLGGFGLGRVLKGGLEVFGYCLRVERHALGRGRHQPEHGCGRQQSRQNGR